MDNATYQRIDEITQRVLGSKEGAGDGQCTAEEGQWLISLHHDYLPWLMAGADRIRKMNRGDEIFLMCVPAIVQKIVPFARKAATIKRMLRLTVISKVLS